VDIAADSLAKNYSNEYRNAAEWFVSNKIKVVTNHRPDVPELPCITIALSRSQEDTRRATIGDTAFQGIGHAEPEMLMKQPTKIYREFTPTAYDPDTGTVTMPHGLDTYQIAPGLHSLVEKNTGKAFVIKKCIDSKSFKIAKNCGVELKDCYIAPISDFWNVHCGRAHFQETYEIGTHVSSDPVAALWLSQLVEYVLLKYKAKFLDKRNLKLSTFSSSDIALNPNYTPEKAYSRFFTLSFHTEMYWIEDVYPQIARTVGGILIADGPRSPDELLDQFPSWKMEADKGYVPKEDCE
jgi:hypothetical protein